MNRRLNEPERLRKQALEPVARLGFGAKDHDGLGKQAVEAG